MKNAVKTVSYMFIIILFSKVLGQVREMLLARSYGTGMEANAFVVASQMPLNFFDVVLGSAIVSAFVPVFNEYYQRNGKEKAMDFAADFFGIVIFIAVLISFFGVVCSGWLVSAIAAGLDAQTSILTAGLLRIMFPMIIFTAAAFTFTGMLQSFDEFNIPAAMSVVSNGITILYFLIFNRYFGIWGLAVSMLVGWSLQLVCLIPALKKKGCRIRIGFGFLSDGMKRVYKLAGPILISSWVQPLNVLVNTALASHLNDGQAVSALNYANKLYLIIVGVFAMAVSNLLLPVVSKMVAASQWEEISGAVRSALKAVFLCVLPIMTVFIVLRIPIVKVIYQRGAFSELSVVLTSSALFYYSFGMLGFGICEILNKSFYAMQKNVIPMKTAFITIGVNILLSVTLVRVMGVGGLALAAAVAASVGAFVLLVNMRKICPAIFERSLSVAFLKALASSVMMGLIIWWLYKVLNVYSGTVWKSLIVLGGTSMAGLATYAVCLYLLKVNEVLLALRSLIKRRG